MRPGRLTHWFKLISKLQPKITFWFTTFSGTPVFREHLQAGTVLHKVHKHMFNYSMDVINSMFKVRHVLKTCYWLGVFSGSIRYSDAPHFPVLWSSISGKNIRISWGHTHRRTHPKLVSDFIFLNYNFCTYSPHVLTCTDYRHDNSMYVIRMY